jgi:hypothetical protein
MEKAIHFAAFLFQGANKFSPSPRMLHKAAFMARKQQSDVHCLILKFFQSVANPTPLPSPLLLGLSIMLERHVGGSANALHGGGNKSVASA